MAVETTDEIYGELEPMSPLAAAEFTATFYVETLREIADYIEEHPEVIGEKTIGETYDDVLGILNARREAENAVTYSEMYGDDDAEPDSADD